MTDNPALIGRTVEPCADGKFKITERWDWKHPQCPFWIAPNVRATLADADCIVHERLAPSEDSQ